MVYKNMWEYLNDQVREPIKKELKKGNVKGAMKILDWYFMQEIKNNALCKAFEDIAIKKCPELAHYSIQKLLKSANKYMPKQKIVWSKLPKPMSDKRK